MLQSLRIRNLAIADDVAVEFAPGLNVITGETGAGKSLMVAALNLVLGERADRTLIRSGEEVCTVEAAFELDDARPVNAVLDTLGLAACDGGQLIVRRIISAAGAGRNLVNDSPATLLGLKALGDVLVDLHGPHDHQSLLSPAFQLSVLDDFGHTQKELSAYHERFDAIRALEARRAELEAAGENTAERIETLRYQLAEIDAAQVTADEDDAVNEELTRVANASRILELAGAVRAALTDDEAGAFNGLVAAQRALGDLTDLMGRAAEDWLREAKGLAMQVQELSNTVASEAERTDADPGRLQWLENRMATIQALKRKYGATLAEVLVSRERIAVALGDLESRGERLAAMDLDLCDLRNRLAECGAALTAVRSRAARKLSAAVLKELRDLGFAHGGFDAALTPSEPQRSGMDVAEFGFAPNVGEPMRPFRAIASSGEISRVMLAVKAALAAHDRIPVLVFDEIDANLGGVTGSAVGLKLAHVAGTHQVLCITHLPQVAVHGARHLVVGKEVRQKRTLTRIALVEGDARAEEVARMLGGKDLTSVTLQHAREMLKPVH